jgi:transposase
MYYMGVDHHKQRSHLTIMEEDGTIVKAGPVLNYRSEIQEFLQGLEKEMQAVVEAGYSSYVLVDILEDLGVDVKVAHPLEVKAIAKAKIKTDKRDSRILADLLRANLIPEAHKRLPESRRSQRVLRQRAFFVAAMTRVKNRIRALLAQQSADIQKEIGWEKEVFSRKGIERLKGLELGSVDTALLEGLLKFYEDLRALIKTSDKLVEELFERMTDAQRIYTVPGFGKFFAVLVATEIDDIRRFQSPAKLHSYAGVIPSTHSSGLRTYQGKMTREGNRWLRWAAVEAVWPAIRHDRGLELFYLKYASRKKANAAKVATARRLLTIIYAILKEGRHYAPFHKSDGEEKKSGCLR